MRFVACVLALLSTTSEAAPPSMEALIRALSQDDSATPVTPFSAPIAMATELGESSVPALAKQLKSASSEKERRDTAMALVYAGGSPAVDALEAEFKRNPSLSVKTSYFLAAPFAATPPRVDALIAGLEGPLYGDEWPGQVAAAHSLGLLKDSRAIGPLEKKGASEGFSGEAARYALTLIREPRPSITFASPSTNDDVSAALVAAGMLWHTKSERLCERSTSPRTWTKARTGWVVDAGCPTESKVPSLSIDAYRSGDGTRSVVAVGFYYGPLNAIGYNYILRKDAAGWRVLSLIFTWVS